MTEPQSTAAYDRVHAARLAKEHERDAIAAEAGIGSDVRAVDHLEPEIQAEWDTANDQVSDLIAMEESTRANQRPTP